MILLLTPAYLLKVEYLEKGKKKYTKGKFFESERFLMLEFLNEMLLMHLDSAHINLKI
jgi:hypothetical protein